MTTKLTIVQEESAPAARSAPAPAEGITFEYREVTEVGEVEALLALRHRVYSSTPAVRGFVDASGPAVLVDAYDRYSRLYGLYLRSAGKATPIGTMRIVTLQPGVLGKALWMIASRHHRVAEKLRAPRRKMLPFLEHCTLQPEIEKHVQRAIVSGEAVVEAGRFAVDPDYRSERAVQGGLARFMIENAMAQLYLSGGCDHAFIDCATGHMRLYAPHGFREIIPGARVHFPGSGAESACMHVTREMVPADVAERAFDRAAEYAATGRVVLDPNTLVLQAHDQPRLATAS